tara:strand:- start:149 stop:709 length:561 start_codon:yes stop_codon:yes gene_type:complete
MGQFAGQPDFATYAKAITPSDTLDASTFLNGAAIYVGGVGDINVVMAGTAPKETVIGFSSLGYTGSTGSNYTAGAGIATDTNSAAGAALTVDITVEDGAVASIVVNAAGSGYKNGDLISVAQPGSDGNALFRVVTEFVNITNPGDLDPASLQPVAFTGLAKGSFVPVIVDYVLATKTTATNIVACY